MKSFWLSALALACAVGLMAGCSVFGGKAAPATYGAQLTGDQEVPQVVTDATGAVTFQLDEDQTQMHFKLAVSNVTDVQAAHVHVALAGMNGPVVAILFAGPMQAGSFSGVLAEGIITGADLVGEMRGMTLAELVDDMAAGRVYVNVHTKEFPDGGLRGQVGAGAGQ